MILVEDAKHFQFFAAQVKDAIEKYGTLNDDTLLELQRERVNRLSAIELEFRDELLKHPKAEDAFKVFYDHILLEKKNLLSARPFFREHHERFGQGIMDSLRDRNYKKTGEYHLNFHFITLLVKKVGLKDAPNLLKIHKEVVKIRQDLILMNLPLIISRARIFYSKTPKSHLSFMDLVQIGVGGFLSAIDKYYGEYTRVWRGVGVGRISGDHISGYNQTMLHFYPDEKRVLYRAHKVVAHKVEGDYSEKDLLEQVNADNRKDKSKKENREDASPEDIRQLLMAASVVSCDTRPPLDDENVGEENVNRLQAAEDTRPDVRLEKAEGLAVLRLSMSTLNLLDKKILRMKGIEL